MLKIPQLQNFETDNTLQLGIFSSSKNYELLDFVEFDVSTLNF